MTEAREDRKKRRKALVTGGAGFIGSHLSELLLQDGWDVYCLDDLSTGSMANVAHLRHRHDYHFFVNSVRSYEIVNTLISECDTVYHLAAAVGVHRVYEQPVETLLTNLEGTARVIDACRRFGKRLLIASTSEVYGDHGNQKPLHENSARIYGPTTARRWAYADSKATNELLALAHHQEDKLDCVIVRLFNTAGPRQTGKYGMVIPKFVERALRGEPLEVFGDGNQTRCFCHVHDAVRAMKALMSEPSTSGQIYNIGSPECIRIINLAENILALTSSNSAIRFVPYALIRGQQVQDVHHRMPSISKIANAIGWRPTLGVRRILTDTIEFKRAELNADLMHCTF